MKTEANDSGYMIYIFPASGVLATKYVLPVSIRFCQN